ncbi:glycoside hydrolase family 3 protein [Butyrivibrio fibrisolvens]|uniref:Beta-glucosidase n=1 Tax=Butyrivibrio fibrisolvens TaxID=831 RepID=A0A317G6R5_BUTFI|nr:glycoside hydrolase family 3 protein [Butyrivibrio fibrisolvens]PWT28976.1 beta-glucosidase [Butyrivibrio fibrisolvens]
MGKFYALTSDEVTSLEKENQALVRSLAGECMVVLENDGALPLGKEERTIVLYGSGARNTVKGGTGSGDVNSREVVNIYEGLKAEGFNILSDDWLDRYDKTLEDATNAYMADINEKAAKQHVPPIMIMFSTPFVAPDEELITQVKDADIAIYVISRNSGEGADRYDVKKDYELDDNEVKNIQFLAANYKKTIVLLNTGGVIDTKVLRNTDGINAVMIAGQMGNIGGNIVSDVLTGKSIPSGKLTDTWAENYSDYPSSATFSHNNGNIDDEYYTEGIYVGYRYFDTFGIKPAYSFGYGKGYTDFAYEVDDVIADEKKVYVSVTVTNTGSKYAGREVIQVYVTSPEGAIDKPFKELRGFAKTSLLGPSQKETVTIAFDTASMASYDITRASYVLEKGQYIIRVGNSCDNTRPAAVLTLDRDVVTVKCRNLFGLDEAVEEIQAPKREKEDISGLKEIALDSSKFTTSVIEYQIDRPVLEDKRSGEKLTMDDVKSGNATLKELVAQLTLEEMANLCVGLFDHSASNVVGSASGSVVGAAGETIGIPDRKIIPTVNADGPAGLRLQPHFKTTADGQVLPGGEVFGLSRNPFPDDTPADAIDYYQYCTAIPIASTLAQSWDMELIEKMGHIVGTEMQQFHVHLWLAPGMNIHRNPLCGRNFEYYSEDPLIAGSCAAADTKGVQSFAGQGTTIKHFAANSQEDNRMYNNAHISERTLREIYLKGFEIAVKDSQPLSVMTSYNLINGIHSANSKDLLQGALRDEWGFKGFVMTDWFSSQDARSIGLAPANVKYDCASSPDCIKAGNDVQMPGSKQNVDDIIKGVEDGRITLGDVQFCALNILGVVAKCE